MIISCLGDSYTEGYLVDKNYTDYLKDAGHEIINLGKNGDRTRDMLDRFDPKPCQVQIIFAGTNDNFDGISPEESFANIKKMIEKSKAARNIVIGPPLMEEIDSYPRYKTINKSIRRLGDLLESLDIVYIDAKLITPAYIDGLHMGESFHKKLAQEIIKLL